MLKVFIHGRDTCVEETIQFDILIGLKVYYPDVDLIQSRLANLTPFRNIYPKKEEVQSYFKDVREWIKKQFNIEFKQDAPSILALKGFCRK